LRFTSEGLEDFSVGRLKNFTDKSQKETGWKNDDD